MENLEEFLEESNLIEGEDSEEALEDAKYAWEYLIAFDTLTPDNLLGTHSILMRRLNTRIAGKLRNCNVRIGNKICPTFDRVPKMLVTWFMNHHDANTEGRIKRAHIAFEKIHPFEDGNGRIGRIIMNWQRVKNDLPILVILADERWDYYQWFKGI